MSSEFLESLGIESGTRTHQRCTHEATLRALTRGVSPASLVIVLDEFVAGYAWCPDDPHVQACVHEAAWIRENLDAVGHSKHQHEALGITAPRVPLGTSQRKDGAP